MCLLYLIRHGATPNNEAHPPRLQGRRVDAGLSAQGRQQAWHTARWLAGQGLDAVYASPLLRARQTAEEIAKLQGLAVELVDDLVEVDVGRWEGLTWEKIEKDYPEAYRLFMTDASVHPYLDGENLTAVQSRTIPAMARLTAADIGRRVAVVAHNVVNRAYLAHLLDVPVRHYRSIPQDNCGINVIQCADGKAKLITVNAVWHLPRAERI